MILGVKPTDGEMTACDIALTSGKFLTFPASTKKHHVWEGGLVDHTEQVVALALELAVTSASFGPFIDLSVVAIASLFHDFGKIDDYQWSSGGWVKTDHYQKIHHVVKSYEYFMEYSKNRISDPKRQEIGHCILAHHGSLAYGSPVLPATREAWAVHLGDMASVQCVERRLSTN
jgi:3'-5' exoribonuclease